MSYGQRWQAQPRNSSKISEKITATSEAAEALLRGGDFFRIVDRYHEHVTANATRRAC